MLEPNANQPHASQVPISSKLEFASSLHKIPLLLALLGSVLRRAQTTINEKDRLVVKGSYESIDDDDGGDASQASSRSSVLEDGTTDLLKAAIRSAETTINSKQQQQLKPSQQELSPSSNTIS